MKDAWYADKRDLIKWGVLFRLAERYEAVRIIQLAYYRPSTYGQLEIDGQAYEIPEEVSAHFRNLRMVGSIASKVRVTVFDPIFQDRISHQQAVISLLPAFAAERCIVFLDPDTGLEPQNPTFDHVLGSEAGAIWAAMKKGDIFSFYQHQTNRARQPWIEPKRDQLAAALGITPTEIKTASGPAIAQDVVLFFTQKA